MSFRIGHGYDVHRLASGRRLIIGGVEIPYELGLQGHSDADVLVHAVMDALLGAAALPDIGQLFPDNDPSLEGVDSLKLMARVTELLHQEGWKVENVDSTIVAQRPKMAPHIPLMREHMAEVLGVDITQINVKATTEEYLGFTGEGLGIAAHAVALLSR